MKYDYEYQVSQREGWPLLIVALAMMVSWVVE
jgi:hypothetical protein